MGCCGGGGGLSRLIMWANIYSCYLDKSIKVVYGRMAFLSAYSHHFSLLATVVYQWQDLFLSRYGTECCDSGFCHTPKQGVSVKRTQVFSSIIWTLFTGFILFVILPCTSVFHLKTLGKKRKRKKKKVKSKMRFIEFIS